MRAKKYIIVYAVAIFLIIFLITFNSVCAITQFDVRYTVGSEKMTRAAERVQDTLDSRYLNKSFLFFKDSDIRNVVADEGNNRYTYRGITRTFPNKITVSVREKFENYAFVAQTKNADGSVSYTYYAVGDDGTVLAVNQENKSDIFDGRNIEIVGFAFPLRGGGRTIRRERRVRRGVRALQTMFGVISDLGLRGNVLRIEYDGFFELPDPAELVPAVHHRLQRGCTDRHPRPADRCAEKGAGRVRRLYPPGRTGGGYRQNGGPHRDTRRGGRRPDGRLYAQRESRPHGSFRRMSKIPKITSEIPGFFVRGMFFY